MVVAQHVFSRPVLQRYVGDQHEGGEALLFLLDDVLALRTDPQLDAVADRARRLLPLAWPATPAALEHDLLPKGCVFGAVLGVDTAS